MCVCVHPRRRGSRSFPPRVIRARQLESLGRSLLQSYLRLLSSFSREIGSSSAEELFYFRRSRVCLSIRLNSIQYGEDKVIKCAVYCTGKAFNLVEDVNLSILIIELSTLGIIVAFRSNEHETNTTPRIEI